MSAGRVVRLQDLPNEHEEVEQPAAAQCRPDGRFPFAFAERLIADMGMGYVVDTLGRVGFLRNQLVGTSSANLLPGQHNPERPQVHVLQDDWSREDADRSFLEVQSDFVELLLQRRQIGSHFAG